MNKTDELLKGVDSGNGLSDQHICLIPVYHSLEPIHKGHEILT